MITRGTSADVESCAGLLLFRTGNLISHAGKGLRDLLAVYFMFRAGNVISHAGKGLRDLSASREPLAVPDLSQMHQENPLKPRNPPIHDHLWHHDYPWQTQDSSIFQTGLIVQIQWYRVAPCSCSP